MVLSIRAFNITRSRISVGEAFFRSKIFGADANSISLEFNNGILTVILKPTLPDWVRKYDGISNITYDGTSISVNGVHIANGNELRTNENRIVFPTTYSIAPTIETFTILTIQETVEGIITTGYSLADAREKTQMSNLISMPVRPGGDIQSQGADGAFIQPFGRVFMAGGGGLPSNALECDTGPFRTLVKVAGREDDTGSIQGVDELYEWDGETKHLGRWKPFR